MVKHSKNIIIFTYFIEIHAAEERQINPKLSLGEMNTISHRLPFKSSYILYVYIYIAHILELKKIFKPKLSSLTNFFLLNLNLVYSQYSNKG